MSVNNTIISCKDVWKIFGPNAQSVIENVASNGITKQELLERTGHVIAVKEVFFEVHKSEIFVVMGLSGSGKSTLVRCINRLIEPTKGTVLIEGADIAQMNKTELREIRRHKLSMVFQGFGLLPHRSVLDNVAYGLEVRGEARKERQEHAIQAIELVGLKGWERSRIYELSGGMQQRVGLARALAVDTEILLMDEPFSALDPLIRRQMQAEFISLMSVVHKTIIFITHDLNEALKLGNRIAIMKDGEIVQIGTPAEIVVHPANEYVTEFVRDVPKVQVLRAGNIMERTSELADIDHELGAVLSTMKAKNLESMFVVDSDQKLRGLVMIEDLTTAVHKGETKLESTMKAGLAITEPDKLIEELIPMVAASNIPIAVVDQQQRLLGMVTRASVLSNMVER